MTTLSLVLGVALAVAAVVLVALPFLREPVTSDDRLDATTPEEERRLRLVEERDRALAALKELELDHRTGKLDDDDYRTLVWPLRRAAAQALHALDDSGEPRAGTNGRMSEPLTPAPVPEPYPPPDEGTPPPVPSIPQPSPQE